MKDMDFLNSKLLLESEQVEPGEISWRSPSNLAIIKYWGKYGDQLPRNPSLSLTLDSSFTETTLVYRAKEETDQSIDLQLFFGNSRNEQFEARVKKYFDTLTPLLPFLQQLTFEIHTVNSFPHSAGIASSASSMSALALCLASLEHELFESLGDDKEFDRKASYLARLGSGSACRSIFPGMALWGETGEVEGSSDQFAIPMEMYVHDIFKTMHDDILIIDSGAKSVSSRVGHELMEGNVYAEARYAQARHRLHFLLEALKAGDFDSLGKIAEDEALTLHAMMMCSNPSYILLKYNTLNVIEHVRAFRQETKLPVYFSLDAGPNIHLLYPESIVHDVRTFVEEELTQFCEGRRFLGDWAGEGPIQL
jgi:diphosphomevalonate decarboxylase